MKWIIISLSGLVILAAAAGFRPINTSECNSEKLVGNIVKVFEAGEYDLNFRIEGEETVFYINRGLEHTFKLTEVRNELLGKEVTLYYARHWTLIPNNYSRHVTRLEYNGEVRYNEWD